MAVTTSKTSEHTSKQSVECYVAKPNANQTVRVSVEHSERGFRMLTILNDLFSEQVGEYVEK